MSEHSLSLSYPLILGIAGAISSLLVLFWPYPSIPTNLFE